MQQVDIALDRVGARTAVDTPASETAEIQDEDIVAGIAAQPVGPFARCEDIVSSTAVDHIVVLRADEIVIVVRAGDGDAGGR